MVEEEKILTKEGQKTSPCFKTDAGRKDQQPRKNKKNLNWRDKQSDKDLNSGNNKENADSTSTPPMDNIRTRSKRKLLRTKWRKDCSIKNILKGIIWRWFLMQAPMALITNSISILIPFSGRWNKPTLGSHWNHGEDYQTKRPLPSKPNPI